MTRTEVYDLACTKLSNPAVVVMGDRHIIGQWVKLAEFNEVLTVLTSKTKGVRVVSEGSSWEEAVMKAEVEGWPTHEADVRVTDTRLATIADVPIPFKLGEACKTYGCNEPRKADDPFCPKCFEEHRDAREVQEPPPASKA